jgi:hypothetical protein
VRMLMAYFEHARADTFGAEGGRDAGERASHGAVSPSTQST